MIGDFQSFFQSACAEKAIYQFLVEILALQVLQLAGIE